MSTGHLFDKIFFFIGVVFILAGLAGFKMRFWERAPTTLSGLGLVAMTLKWLVPLSTGTQDTMETLGLVALCVAVFLNWRRRKSSGAAA